MIISIIYYVTFKDNYTHTHINTFLPLICITLHLYKMLYMLEFYILYLTTYESYSMKYIIYNFVLNLFQWQRKTLSSSLFLSLQ